MALRPVGWALAIAALMVALPAGARDDAAAPDPRDTVGGAPDFADTYGLRVTYAGRDRGDLLASNRSRFRGELPAWYFEPQTYGAHRADFPQ